MPAVFRRLLPALVAAVSVALGALASDIPRAQREAIEAVLAHVAALKDSSFIRNGKAYDAAAAATFLRRKWESRAGSVTNVADFIARIASESSTSGKPYRIRFADGRETDCGAYLESLAKTNGWLDAPPPAGR